MKVKSTGWSVRWDALLDIPSDPEYPYRITEQLSAAGADGPVVGIGRNHDRISARFDVQGVSPMDAATRAWEIWSEVLPDAVVVDFEGQTQAEIDKRLAQTAGPDLAGAQELARTLGISRQRFYEVAKMPGFPKPVVQLASGPVWIASSINHFVETWPRKGGRPGKTARPTRPTKELA